MDEKDLAAIRKRLTVALANLNALELLALALFDASPNKERVISQFSKTTEGTSVEMLHSTMPDGFRHEFELQRKVLLALLNDAASLPEA